MTRPDLSFLSVVRDGPDDYVIGNGERFVNVPEIAADVVALLDGTRTVDEVRAEIHRARGVDVDVAGFVRGLDAAGLLRPPERPPNLWDRISPAVARPFFSPAANVLIGLVTCAALAAVITELDPGLLGVQEVGDPGALEDLAGMLDDDWHVALSSHADSRGIRVGFLSRTELTVVADTAAFPPRMLPVQADHTGLTVSQAGRGFLAVEVAGERGPLRVAVCHLKSKLLSYPDGRFQPRDEGERARYGAYALYVWLSGRVPDRAASPADP